MIALFLVLLFPWNTLSSKCYSTYVLSEFKIHGHMIKTVSSLTRSQCEHQCAAQQGCNSISFNENKGKCELHDGNHISHPESVLPSDGYIYVNFPARPPKKCSRKLCSEPLVCVPEGESYKCVSCEEAKAEQVLSFPRKSAQDYVILDDPFVSLSSFTLSLWIQIDSTSKSNAVFQYGTPSNPDITMEIYVTNTYYWVDVMGDGKSASINLVDNKWHHFCLTWENTGGNIKFYIDGTLSFEIKGKQGKEIGKGSIVLGQDQDGFKRGFQSWQALHGNLTSVNMWRKVFSSEEVLVLASTCPTSEGDVVQWSALKIKGAGMTKLVCSSLCME